MTRRCSHCSNNGHNSRTCPTRGGTTASGVSNSGVKLFGVRLIDGTMMKKSASMSNLSLHIHSSALNPGSPSSDPVAVADGYLSDDLAHGSSNRRAERKKGVPWTEEEHRLFLIGLHKLGKGDWRGIARHYVKTRTPTQVASHAQKFFIRQSNVGRRRRRSSLFDMSADVEIDAPLMPDESAMPPLPLKEDDKSNSMPSLNLSLSSEFDSMEKDQESEESHLPPHEAFPLFLPGGIVEAASASACYPHQILKPIPLLLKEPVNVDALVGMSHLSLVEDREPSPPSLKPSRQSAFHVSSGSRFLIPQIRNH